MLLFRQVHKYHKAYTNRIEHTRFHKMLEGAALGIEVSALLSKHIAELRELSSFISLSVKFYLFLTWKAIVPNKDQLTRGWRDHERPFG